MISLRQFVLFGEQDDVRGGNWRAHEFEKDTKKEKLGWKFFSGNLFKSFIIFELTSAYVKACTNRTPRRVCW